MVPWMWTQLSNRCSARLYTEVLKQFLPCQLLLLFEEVDRRIDEVEQVKVCYLEFSKASDSLNHRLLSTKAETLGIRGRVYSAWLSFSLGAFCVRTGDRWSVRLDFTGGVPQRSMFGPFSVLVLIITLYWAIKSLSFCFSGSISW